MKFDVVVYFCIILAAFLVAMFFPSYLSPLAPFSTYILGGIFLITALQLRVADIISHVKELRMVVLASLWLLLGLPIIVYLLSVWLVPEYATALLLLSAMPAGMTAPLLTKIAGGREEFALVIAVVTSLLAPISIPVVAFLLLGTQVVVDPVSMATSLMLVIVVPFIIGGIITYVVPSIKNLSQKLHPVSLLLLGVLIASLVSDQSKVIQDQIMDGTIMWPLGILFVFFIVLHVFGYVVSRFAKRSLHVASIVSLVYMNFTLAIYIAYTFFPDASVVVPVTLSIIPWAILIIPFTLLYTYAHGSDT